MEDGDFLIRNYADFSIENESIDVMRLLPYGQSLANLTHLNILL